MPSDIVPESLLGGNYDDNIAFITGFITAYTGQAANIPATCFDANTQNTLNADLGAFMLQIATGNTGEAIQKLQTFLKDLAIAEYNCGLNFIPANLQTDLSTKGGFYLLVNVIHNLPNMKTSFYDTINLINTQQWGPAGTAFGTLVSYLIPVPTSSATLQASPSKWSSFTKGLLNGLEGNTAEPGKCYQAFMTAGQQLPNVIAAYEKVETEGISEILNFAQIVQEFLPYLTPIDKECAWGALEAQIHAVFDGGLKAFLIRYYNNLKTIDSDVIAVRSCSKNYMECGRSLGEIVRIMFDWSLDTPVTLEDGKPTEWQDIVSFAKGLASGLEGQVSTMGPCYQGLAVAGTSFESIVSDAARLKGGDVMAVHDLMTDLDAFKPQYEALDGVCDFGALLSAIDDLFKPDGYKPFFVRYYKYLQTINADIYHVVHCSKNYSLCGQSLGNAIDLLFNWTLQ